MASSLTSNSWASGNVYKVVEELVDLNGHSSARGDILFLLNGETFLGGKNLFTIGQLDHLSSEKVS